METLTSASNQSPPDGDSQPGETAPTRRKRSIAFIKRGIFSHINRRVCEALREHFPEYDLVEIDLVEEILRRRKGVILVNLFHILRLYWRDLLRGRRSIRLCFYHTPYIFRKIRELVSAHLETNLPDCAFTFQTQTLYDAGTGKCPHFVYTDHTHLANLYYPGFDTAKLWDRSWIDLERLIYHGASKTFVMSSHVRRSVIEHYDCPADRVSCVYAGSNIVEPAPLANDGYRSRRILFIGVDWERKGGPDLERAFRRVLERVPDARLVVVGCSPALEMPGVEILGRVPLEEVTRQITLASVFCFPTKIEPFGIVTLEAMIHRLPVVATRVGALPDLVVEGKTGRLVEPGDVEALAEALIELLLDPELCRRYGEHGFQLASEKFTWQAVGARFKSEIAPFLH